MNVKLRVIHLSGKYLSLLILLVMVVSCAKKLDESYIPAYIKIDELGLRTSGNQGSALSYFTDAWVYLDGADMGAYPLPADIPLLAEGKHLIKIHPGIKLNGVAGTRVPYPLVAPIEIELDLIKDSIHDLDLSTWYYSNVRFPLVEGFEGVNQAFETTVNSTAEWTKSSTAVDPPSYVYEGLYSGKAVLNEEHPYLQIITRELISDLPKNGIPSFIEMDFKCNTTIIVGLMSYINGIGETNNLIYLSPTEEWKKIYINLTSTISYQLNATDYKFVISADHYPGNEESIVLIDNFKVVHRSQEK